jgi:uncharacterized protein
MRLIENLVKIPIDEIEETFVLINTLNGFADILNIDESCILDYWKSEECISPITEKESKFFQQLYDRQYIVENKEQENILRKQVMEWCRKRHNQHSENLSHVALVLTYNCNFACPYCYERDNTLETKTLTKEMVDKVFLIHNDNIKSICFYGGEPFLPSCRDIIEYIVQKAPLASYSAVTNGYYIAEYFPILKKLNVEFIQITLDGTEKFHNKTRILKNGQSTYVKIFEGLEMCLKEHMRVKIRMNISSQNIDSCLSLRDELSIKYKNNLLDGTLLFEMQPIFQTDKDSKLELEHRIYFEEFTKKLKSPKDKYGYNTMIETLSPIMHFFATGSKKIMPLYCHCDAELNRRFYDPEGNVYSCILSVGNQVASIGRYYPEYILKDNSIATRTIESIEKCSECKLAFLCGGGCAYGVIDEGGDVMRTNCTEIYKTLFHDIALVYRSMINK